MQAEGKLCLAAAIFLAGVCFAAPHPRYRVIDLGVLPNGTRSFATALNDKGEVVGDCDTPEGTHAFLFSQGQMTDINSSLQWQYHGATFTSGEGHARDINNRSEVIGAGQYFGGGTGSQFIYSNGLAHFFSGGYPVFDNQIFPIFFSINDLGHIQGLAGNGRYAVTDRQKVWFFPSLGGTTGAKGLNNYDEATGYFAPPGPTFTYLPVLLRTNAVVEIELPEGGINGTGWALNDAGHVVGSYIAIIDEAEIERTFLYRDGTTTDIGSGRPSAINNSDEAVGFNENGCFVYTGGRMFSLNDTIPPGLGFDIRGANDINNNGVIAGSAVRNGQEHAVILIPLNRKSSR